MFVKLLLTAFLLTIWNASTLNALEVVYAVNAGGDSHNDINKIHYIKDPLMNKTGTHSDYGKNSPIGRVHHDDQYLYQTERYHTKSFSYHLPLVGDGEYGLLLKFSEVFFTEPNQKVFSVVLNRKHTVIRDLDIFSVVGNSVAHDKIVRFKISHGRLYYKDEDSEIQSARIPLRFAKGDQDNPKINAFVLFRGDIQKIPRLPPLKPVEGQEQALAGKDEQEPVEPKVQRERQWKTSGPAHPDPYDDDKFVMLPVFVVIAGLIPILYLLNSM